MSNLKMGRRSFIAGVGLTAFGLGYSRRAEAGLAGSIADVEQWNVQGGPSVAFPAGALKSPAGQITTLDKDVLVGDVCFPKGTRIAAYNDIPVGMNGTLIVEALYNDKGTARRVYLQVPRVSKKENGGESGRMVVIGRRADALRAGAVGGLSLVVNHEGFSDPNGVLRLPREPKPTSCGGRASLEQGPEQTAGFSNRFAQMRGRLRAALGA